MSKQKKAKVKIVITTYNRPESFERTLKEVDRWIEQNPSYNISVHIYDDFSNPRYRESNRQATRQRGFRYKCFPKNHGKKRFWELWNYILTDLKQMEFNYVVCLQDDCDYSYNFLNEVVQYCKMLEKSDSNFAALNVRNDRLGEKCWTKVKPKLVFIGGTKFYKTGWVDMIFVSNSNFIKAVENNLEEVNKGRWEKDKKRSSGVGHQISEKIVEKGYTIYQPITKLVHHKLAYSSKMNRHRLKEERL